MRSDSEVRHSLGEGGRKNRRSLHVDIPEHIFITIKEICRKRGITMTQLLIRLFILAIKEDREN